MVISWRGGDAKRCKSQTRDETFVSDASFLGPPKISDFWGEQRPWSPADLIGVPRELRSNGERRSDGALYFGMPKSFSEIRDDEGYATQVPNASAKVLLFWHLANSCPGIENGMSGPLLQRIRFPFANRRRETQKLQVSKIQNFASTRWKQLQVRGGCKINLLIPAFL